MTSTEIDEFNKFLGENPLRNKFLPIVYHIKNLTPDAWSIAEYQNLNGETSSVVATIDTGKYKGVDNITVKIHYDTMPNHEGEIIYEMYWGEENYCLASPSAFQINRVKNMLTMLIKQIGFKEFNCDMKEYRKAQRGEYLLNI
jgi:hypothetical protein